MQYRSKFQKIWNQAKSHPDNLVTIGLQYLQSLNERNYSFHTHESRRCYLGFFLTWCKQRDVTTKQQVTRKLIEDYQTYLCEYRSQRCKGVLTANSKRLHLHALNLFFRWMIRQQMLLHNPAADIEIPRPAAYLPRNILTQLEAESVINQPDIKKPSGLRDRAILETFYSTGVRAQELVNLRVTDLDMQRMTLLVQEGKGKKDRVVPIGERAVRWIEKYLLEVRAKQLGERQPGALFLTQYGRPFATSSTVGQIVKGYLISAGITKSGCCHLFRHSMATLMLENGADIRYIKDILGHADLKTTDNYTKVTIGKLRQVHALAHPASLGEQPQLPQTAFEIPVSAPVSPDCRRGPKNKLDAFWNSSQCPDDFCALASKFFNWLSIRNYSPQTIASYRIQLKPFVEWCQERSIYKPSQVTSCAIDRYQTHFSRAKDPATDRPVSAGHRRNRFTIISRFFRYLVQKHYLLQNPTSHVQAIKIPKRLPRNTLNADEVEKVLLQPNLHTLKGLRDRAVLETIYSSGLRRSEISALDVNDINFTNHTIFVHKGKGNRDRVVPVTPRALNWLQTYLEQVRPLWVLDISPDALFLNKDGGRFNRNTVSNMTTGYIKKANLGKSGSAHTLRHSMATLMLENGADIRYIKDILGHSRVTTTEIYTRVTIAKLKEVHTKTHPARMNPTKTQQIISELEKTAGS